MMNLIRAIAIVLTLANAAVAAEDVQKSPLPRGHPLPGTWRIDLPNGCFEEYTIQDDGTKISRSHEERNESIFEISEQPSPKGYYRWVDQIIKGNGKPDCSGSTTAVGHRAVNFIRLHPNGNRFLLCKAEALNSCFAEFYRTGRDI